MPELATLDVEELRRSIVTTLLRAELAGRQPSPWRESDSVYAAAGARRAAARVIQIADEADNAHDAELRLQEELYRRGWNNPLRCAARLVDGPLRPLITEPAW